MGSLLCRGLLNEDMMIRSVIAPCKEPLWAAEIFFQIQRTARASARCFDAELRPLGLTNGQFIILMFLNHQEDSGMTDLASLLAIDRTTLTAALKTLERRGLVKITNHPSDHRVRRTRLTRRGKALTMTCLPVWKRASREIESRLAGIDLDSIRQFLQALS
jgi:DNA-binding MarR family transcriptional regulator